MKLALYSGGDGRENKSLVQEALALLEGKPSPLIAFIPAHGEDSAEDFQDFRRKFSRTRVRRFRCVPIDRPLTQAQKERLFSCDAIFLGGGNTYYFLNHLRKSRLLRRLKAFVEGGGVLMGLSAGSILMTPNIMTAAVPSLDCDENEVGLKNLGAMALVPFEFSPHYLPLRTVDDELKRYSRKVSHPIYACADGEGIIVEGRKLRFVGRVKAFHRGRKLSASARSPLQ